MPTRSRVLQIALPALLVAVQWTVAPASAARSASEAELRTTRQAPLLVPVKTRDAFAQSKLSHAPSWKTFQSRYGRWTALWNEATGTPHRAFGPSIPLRGFANDPVRVTEAVREFIADHPDQFGGAGVELKSVDASLHGRVWYVRLQQTVQGLPVLYSDWEFRVGTNGRLMMFGADPRNVPADLQSRAVLPAPVVREAAHLGMKFDLGLDRVDLAPRMAYMPTVRPDGGSDLRLVQEAIVVPARRGEGQRVIVDAGNGAVLLRQPMRADAITGTITAQIHPSTPYDPLLTRPIRWATVKATTGSTTSALTDTTGHYSVIPPGSPCSITTDFTSAYCSIVRVDGPPSSFRRDNVVDPSVVNVAWTTSNSQYAERDAFYHANLAHDWVKEIDPTFTAMDYPLQINVNWNDGLDCEAYWDQLTNSLNFWPDGECPNTATIPDLVWHEYTHMLNFKLYYTHGSSNGLENAALREGLADAASVLIGLEPLIANGFFGPGTYLRDVRVGARYPEFTSKDAHNTGLILAGAMWDFWFAQPGTPLLARTIMQFAKYGLPDDLDDGVAMSEFFVDLLIADDNDSDLGNLTPNFGVINTSFSAHGIGMNYFLSATHTPLGDQPSVGPYPITTTVSYGGPIGALSSAKLFYQASGVPWTAKTMLPTGNPDEFGAQIPKYYGVIRYYLQFTDTYGGTMVLPGGAPNRPPYQFFAGPASTLVSNTMEAPDGWVVGYAADTPVAATGTWVRAVPVQSDAQTGADHTPAGTQCWVTGNALITDPPGVNDVDGGKASLVTTTFNATPAGIVYPVISYWRWYTNDVGDSPNEDPWRVFISNNGGTSWSRIENATTSSNKWERIMFAISDYVTPTNNMKMRFVAQDTINPSIVEAAVDDWTLLGLPSTLDVSGPQALTELMLQPVWPNPAEGDAHMRFTLPTAGRVELRVYDIEGREVRTLIDGDRPPGSQSALWDGRDDAGRRVASGPYFVRLTRGGREVVSRAVVMLR